MNKFVTTAVSLMAVGSINFADPSDNEWLGLDSEIKSISSSLAPNDNGIGMAGLLRFNYSHAEDEISLGPPTASPDNIGGFHFDEIDLAFWTTVGDYTMNVSMDLAGLAGSTSSGTRLQNAYISWECPEDLTISAGRMNPRFLRAGNVTPENLFFLDRSAIGSAAYHYDEGIQVAGAVEDIAWTFGLFNGPDDYDSGHDYYLRGEYSLGEGGGGLEGSHEKAAGTNLTVGVGINHNDAASGSDNMNIGIDVNGNHDKFGFSFTALMIDDDTSATTAGGNAGIFNQPLNFDGSTDALIVGDATPHSLAVFYSINPDWSVGVRAEDLDNVAGNEILTLGVNYMGAGHGSRWSANFTDVSADSGNPDGSFFQVGYTTGFSE